MRGQKALAGYPRQIFPLQLFPRRKRNRMDQNIQPVPVIPKPFKHRPDLPVVGDIAGQGDLRIQFGGQLFNPAAQFIPLIGEGQISALAPHGPGDPPGDGTIAGHTRDQGAFVVK